MGPVAIAATVAPDVTIDAAFAAHAWCASTGSVAGSNTPFELGSVAVIFTNGYNGTAEFSAINAADGTRIPLSPRVEFILTAPSTSDSTADGLLGRVILLNGVPLELLPNGSLPFASFPGLVVNADPLSTITLPPYSYGLVVLQAAGSSTCAERPTERAAYPVTNCSPQATGASSHTQVLSAGAVAGIAVGASVAAAAAAGISYQQLWRRQKAHRLPNGASSAAEDARRLLGG